MLTGSRSENNNPGAASMLNFMGKNMRLGAGLVVLASICSGCASTGAMVSAIECPAPKIQTEDYVIGPGDTLEVVVWRNDELSAIVPVRPDGKISTPLVDDIGAAGRTPSELAADMEGVLGEYIRTPDVSVIVSSQGTSNQIQIVGEVDAPQSLSYRAGLRVLDVVVGAGGMGEFAAGNRANLVRQTSGGQVRCSIKLKDLMGGDMSQNILVYPGDVLVVPESRF